MNGYQSNSFGLAEKAIELNKNPEAGLQQAGASTETLTESNLWLPAAAKVYNISPKLESYVLVPVPVIFSDIPNTNGDSLTIQELLTFDPKMGQLAFKTFRGKPCHYEHANKVIEDAKGVILDVFLRPVKGFGGGKYWKLVLLMAYDRTKDPLLVNSILTGENNAYSVGFYFQAYTCSICGTRVGQGGANSPCEHTVPRKPTYELNGQLVYRQCHSIVGFECSVVASPAYVVAVGKKSMNMAEY